MSAICLLPSFRWAKGSARKVTFFASLLLSQTSPLEPCGSPWRTSATMPLWTYTTDTEQAGNTNKKVHSLF